MTERLAPQVTLCLSNNCFMTIHLHVFHFHNVSSHHLHIFDSLDLIYSKMWLQRVCVLSGGDACQNGDRRMRIIIISREDKQNLCDIYTIN